LAQPKFIKRKINMCDHKTIEKITEINNQELFKCKLCGIIFQKESARTAKENIYDEYYKEETGGRFNPLVEVLVKTFRLLRAIKIYMARPRAKSMLDIGCGRGYTLYFLKKYFHYREIIGTQISKPALEFARKKLGLTIHGKDLLDINFPKNKFDIITIYHVLEHVREPERYIKTIYGLLNRDGILILEVPNYCSWTRIITGKYWLAYDPSHHLYFFTPDYIKEKLVQYGFKIKKHRSFSLEYSTFTSVQSLVSYLTKTEHLFFSWLQNGGFKIIYFWHLLLFVIVTPLSLAVNLFLFFSTYCENIFIVAEKKVESN